MSTQVKTELEIGMDNIRDAKKRLKGIVAAGGAASLSSTTPTTTVPAEDARRHHAVQGQVADTFSQFTNDVMTQIGATAKRVKGIRQAISAQPAMPAAPDRDDVIDVVATEVPDSSKNPSA